MKKQNIGAFAASMAFFLFLSLVPMLALMCTIIPYTPLTQQNLVTAAVELTPDAMDPLVAELIKEVYEKSAGVLSVAAILTVWSAGKGVLALMQGLNAIHNVVEERNYFVVRLLASFYTVVMLVVLLLSLLIMVFGNKLVLVMVYKIPQLRSMIAFLMNFRFLLVWGVLTILFAMIYAYIPNRKLQFKKQIYGASFTAVVWSIFSWGFSVYVENVHGYSIYGSLSLIILVMIWMYICMYIMLTGAFLNRYFYEV